MGRPSLSGGPQTKAVSAVTLAAAVAVTPFLEIGELVNITTAADAGRLFRRNTFTAPAGVVGDFVQVASYAAADLVNVPAGTIASATVQGAINELDTEKGTRAAVGSNVVSLAGNGALAAGTSADETLACAIPATAVVTGIKLSAAMVAGGILSYGFNAGGGNVTIRYANVTAAPIAVAADAGVRVSWWDPAAW